MPKRSKDRGEDPAGILGDEDYDWIKYLGEGRSPAASSAPSSPASSGADATPSSFSSSSSASGGGAARGGATRGASRRGRDRDADRQADSAGPSHRAMDDTGPRGYGAASQVRGTDDHGPGGYGSYGGTGGDGRTSSNGHGYATPGAVGFERGGGAGGYDPAYPRNDRPGSGGRAVPDARPSGGDYRTTSGRAVRLTAGRAVDLQATPAADALFNPAAEEYGQPLYAVPDPGYGSPAGPQRAWADDPLADTDAGRGRPRPAAGTHALPAGRENPAGRPEATGWGEATGWPQTEDDQEAALPSEPTGWPQAPDEQKQSGRGRVPSGRKAAGKKDKAAGKKEVPGRKRAGVPAEAAVASAPRPAASGLAGRTAAAATTSMGTFAEPAASAGPAVAPPAPARTGKQRQKAAPAKARRRGRRRFVLAGAVLVVAVLGAAAYVVLRPQVSHAVSIPPKLGSFTRQAANPTAERLKQKLLAAARGDVKNVVAAGYQRTTGPGTKAGPQIVVFIGGNLAGNASASTLISAYMTQMHGAFGTSPGSLGGKAACAPGAGSGRPAECAWADGDTFGVVVSASLPAPALASEMRLMRPLVEHVSR